MEILIAIVILSVVIAVCMLWSKSSGDSQDEERTSSGTQPKNNSNDWLMYQTMQNMQNSGDLSTPADPDPNLSGSANDTPQPDCSQDSDSTADCPCPADSGSSGYDPSANCSVDSGSSFSGSDSN